MTDDDRRAAVGDAARRLVAAGLCVGTSGNVSVRLDRHRIAITPAGMPYDRMEAGDIVVVDSAGRVLEGPWRPSSELPMHLTLYAARPDIGAVVHTHSLFATAFAAVGRPIPAVHYVIAPLGDSIRVAPYATYGSQELARSVRDTLAGDNAILIARHGAIAVGPTLEVALERAETVEYLAELAYRAEALGGGSPFDGAELERVRAQMRRIPRQDKSES